MSGAERMYLRPQGGFGQAGTAPALALDMRSATPPLAEMGRRLGRRLETLDRLDLVVDLGQRIGSREWWRGLATCTALCVAMGALAPGLRPIDAPSGPAIGEAEWQEASAAAVSPLAYGADTGRRMAPTAAVERLADTPERPSVDLTATLGQGDGFARVLQRNGVGAEEAKQAAALVADAVALGDIRSGTRLSMTLGRRPNRQVPRPLERLDFRAKFELALALERVGNVLTLKRMPIAVDATPLRIQGRVGSSLVSAARSAGAPASAVQAYLRAIGQQLSVARDVNSGDRFDLIVAHRRAATGETETGELMFAGLESARRKVRMLKWTLNGREQWFEASGVGKTQGTMRTPVAGGRMTSSFGMRRHPLLGYSRFHKGMDFGAAYGTPIVAATDGTVAFAGWHGGHGNYVKLNHSGGLGTGYGHMSRIVARVGQRVSAGQVIGYVGSTGLSTGPHLHYEVYKGGQAVNPAGMKFASAPQLAGGELARFRSKLNSLLATRVSSGQTEAAAAETRAAPRKG